MTEQREQQQTVVVKAQEGGKYESALIEGDLARLTEEQRLGYYRQVCESLGLNPWTRPLGYIVLNGRLQLYALRSCTDQLRKIHGISVAQIRQEEADGILTVWVDVTDRDGRTDSDKGCVSIAGLKGDFLANARMKAVTKGKRRATLSICGLGWLDESEVESVPDARPVPEQAPRQAALPEKPAATPKLATIDGRQQEKLLDLLSRIGEREEDFCEGYEVTDLTHLLANAYPQAEEQLRALLKVTKLAKEKGIPLAEVLERYQVQSLLQLDTTQRAKAISGLTSAQPRQQEEPVV